MKKEEAPRLDIDILRVFAIVLIIAFHFIYQITYDNTLRWMGFVGTSLFFIVSGFLLAQHYPKMESFSFRWLWKRFIKIASLYYLALIALALLFGNQSYSGELWKNLLYHFLFIEFISPETAYGIISPAWFLAPLLGLYIAFPYLNSLLKREPRFFLVIFIVLTVLFRVKIESFTSFSPLFFLGEFAFGIAYAHNPRTLLAVIPLFMIFVNPLMILPFMIFFLVYLFNIGSYSIRWIHLLSEQTITLFLFHEAFVRVLLNVWHIGTFNKYFGLVILSGVTLITIYLARKIRLVAYTIIKLKKPLRIKKT